MMLFGDVIEKHLLAGRLLDYVLLFHRFLILSSLKKNLLRLIRSWN